LTSVKQREKQRSTCTFRLAAARSGSQRLALWALSNKNGINLDALCLDEFDVQRADALDIRQASSLIDKLKMQTETAGGVR